MLSSRVWSVIWYQILILLFNFVDHSVVWIKHILLPRLTRLPQHQHELENVLFSDEPEKLPVMKSTFYDIYSRRFHVGEKYPILADAPKLPRFLLCFLNFPPNLWHLDVSTLLDYTLQSLFYFWNTYTSCNFHYKLPFNLNGKVGDSRSDNSRKGWRLDKLIHSWQHPDAPSL